MRKEPSRGYTRKGKPVVPIGMDEEQLQLGSSDKFWRLITERRAEKTISRAELEQRISNRTRRKKSSAGN